MSDSVLWGNREVELFTFLLFFLASLRFFYLAHKTVSFFVSFFFPVRQIMAYLVLLPPFSFSFCHGLNYDSARCYGALRIIRLSRIRELTPSLLLL